MNRTHKRKKGFPKAAALPKMGIVPNNVIKIHSIPK
jgi:hypothetical protein